MKFVLNLAIILLFFATPLLGMGFLGTLVSKKFEVDEMYWRIDGDMILTIDQKKQAIEELDTKGQFLNYKAYAFISAAAFTLISASFLVVCRKKFLSNS